ncbi:hypothetical protein Y032_0052g2210 [Ancylostoma ceylanicum]|uniref:Uncharacterized protein n=1 Tax=Ancylostoma ceylanicum TaxID=53326 RepID=A0A016U7G4_9BILA|nr:hypothetical protein Y032_0052g2210 [Ancylostoma ceylanicum]
MTPFLTGMSRVNVPCPVAMSNPDTDVVLSSMRRMNISQVERNPDRDLRLDRIVLIAFKDHLMIRLVTAAS